MPALTDYNLDSLTAEFTAAGLRAVHARTLLKQFYRGHGAIDLASLRLGRAVEDHVRQNLPLRQSSILRRSESSDGTVKLLLGFQRGGSAETVMMPAFDPGKAAGCLSAQIGCAMGCDFCASTRGGLERNLDAGEIVEQFLHLRALSAGIGRRLSTLVFMGTGEPMHNLGNVMAAIRRMCSPDLGDHGHGLITISTVGIVPGIEQLAASGLGVHLALSLHAPDDATRAGLVPANRRYPVAEIVRAAKEYQARTGRIVNIEYCLLAGINDSDAHANQLADLLDGFRVHVNLIPYNAIGEGVSGTVYARPANERLNRFIEILCARRVVVHFRRTRGGDVDAACGQLRGRHLVEIALGDEEARKESARAKPEKD
ncbi:MAG: 23S rRNA (adenine(2503)-C(2))-methyltransferase RlmN [Tepidisphaerales bacterium]